MNMSVERWQRIELIFQTALDLAPGERSGYVSQASGDDGEIRREVEKLLVDHEQATSLLEEPVYDRSTIREILEILDDESDPMVGRGIGAYEIVREIGRGGMGAVYLASRADNAFQKYVAIKLVKRGMDTDFILRRFRRERQILAALDHPNIARLLDGGTTEDSRPYFVMEYVDGKPLYEYGDAERLNIDARLRLFCRICEAVEHAHRNLIIHRDIKPSNILVTTDGTPKLLDFGIAKLLNPELDSHTAPITATTSRMMTVEYASPEQVCGETVTFLSDVYSLGVLFHELLSGHRPYCFKNRWPHEMARVVVEEEAEPPSLAAGRCDTLLASYGADEGALGRMCRARGATPESLRDKLSGDLDSITLKALRKAPSERYASAAELRADILRHLEGRPVTAPVHTTVPTRRVPVDRVTRASGGTAIAVLPLKVLSAGVTDDTDDKYLGIGLADAMITRLSSVRSLMVRPTSAIMRYGEGESDPLKAGRELHVDYVLDGRVRRVRDRIRVSLQLLDVDAAATLWANHFDEQFTDVLELEDSISAKVAEALLPQLTDTDRQRLKKRGTDNPRAFDAYLRGRYFWNKFTPESLPKALESFEAAIAMDPNYAMAHVGMADFYNWAGIYGILSATESHPRAQVEASRALELDDTLGEAYAALGLTMEGWLWDWDEAERLFRRALELNPNYALAHEWYAALLVGTGRTQEGLVEIRRAEELSPLSLRAMTLSAWTYYQAGLFEEAAKKAGQILELDRHYPQGYIQLGNALERLGRAGDAVEALRHAAVLMPDSALPAAILCFALTAAGRADEAAGVLSEIKRTAETGYVKPYFIAMAQVAVGQIDEAFEYFELAFEERDPWFTWFGTEAKFETLRRDSRFPEMFRRTNNPLSEKQSAGADR